MATPSPLPGADEAALRRLVDAYAFAVDRRDVDAFRQVFTDDGVLCVHDGLEGPARHCYEGRTELATVIEKIARYDQTMHLTTTHRVSIDGDRATGEAMCVAHHLSTTDHGTEDRVLHITYLDQYALGADDAWRIQHRGVHTRFVQTVPVEVAG